MDISPGANPAGVWSVTPRTLTSFGTAISAGHAGDNLALANGTSALLGSGAGTMSLITVVGIALANVTWNFGVVVGAVFRGGITGASGASGMATGVTAGNSGFTINNSGTVSGNYSYAALVWNV